MYQQQPLYAQQGQPQFQPQYAGQPQFGYTTPLQPAYPPLQPQFAQPGPVYTGQPQFQQASQQGDAIFIIPVSGSARKSDDLGGYGVFQAKDHLNRIGATTSVKNGKLYSYISRDPAARQAQEYGIQLLNQYFRNKMALPTADAFMCEVAAKFPYLVAGVGNNRFRVIDDKRCQDVRNKAGIPAGPTPPTTPGGSFVLPASPGYAPVSPSYRTSQDVGALASQLSGLNLTDASGVPLGTLSILSPAIVGNWVTLSGTDNTGVSYTDGPFRIAQVFTTIRLDDAELGARGVPVPVSIDNASGTWRVNDPTYNVGVNFVPAPQPGTPINLPPLPAQQQQFAPQPQQQFAQPQQQQPQYNQPTAPGPPPPTTPGVAQQQFVPQPQQQQQFAQPQQQFVPQPQQQQQFAQPQQQQLPYNQPTAPGPPPPTTPGVAQQQFAQPQQQQFAQPQQQQQQFAQPQQQFVPQPNGPTVNYGGAPPTPSSPGRANQPTAPGPPPPTTPGSPSSPRVTSPQLSRSSPPPPFA